MGLTRIALASLLAATALLTSVASADALVRYAAPNSATTSGLCTVLTPCRLDFAISGAAGGDTVILAPGDYTVSYPVAASALVHVTGTIAQPRPRLLGDASRTAPTIDLQFGGSLKHVYVESASANPAVDVTGVDLEHVLAYSATSSAIVARAGSGATIRDSVAHSTAASAFALELGDDQITGDIDIVNVTAIATGSGSTAIANGSGGVVSIVNTIARGQTGDIVKAPAVQNAVVSYSNYRPSASTGITAGSGNQSGAPVFADAAFHQDAGSPTVDAGTASFAGLGATDPDGNLRLFGLRPDIGAYESPFTASGGGGGDGGGGDPDPGITAPTTDPAPKTGTGSGVTDELPPPAPPALGRSVDLGAVSGTVRVTLPGGSQPIVLEDGANVPVGSVIDATDGVVSLTSVRDSSGTTQTGKFWGGAFKVGQSRSGDQYTVLTLVGDMGSCAARGKLSAAGRRGARRLWGSDNHGRFRTRGRRGIATVRGTQWLTEDRCSGTLFRVKQGAIVVRDFGKRKSVKLTRGESYVAKSR